VAIDLLIERPHMPQPSLVSRVYTGEVHRSLAQRLSPLRWRRCILEDIHQLVDAAPIIREFVSTTLRVRYQTSVLGFLWTLVHPLLILIILSFVFSTIMRFEMDHYPVFLFSGLLPWQFFAVSISTASISLLTNQGLVRKIRIYPMVFPVSTVIVAAVNMLFAMVAMFILLMFLGASISVHLVLLPVGVAFLLVFTMGVALIAMTLTTYFRDFEHIIGVFLQGLFFASPVIYPASAVPKLAPLLAMNPLSWFLAFFHHALYLHTWPSPRLWLVASAVSVVTLLIGYLVYKEHEHKYIFRL